LKKHKFSYLIDILQKAMKKLLSLAHGLLFFMSFRSSIRWGEKEEHSPDLMSEEVIKYL